MEVCVDMMGPLVQILSNKFGYRAVLITGALLMVLGLEMAGFTSQV